MAPRRRPRGSLVDPISVGYVVEQASKDRLDAIAQNAGVSSSLMYEQLIEHVELTDQGIPVWWKPLPRDEELPINGT